MTPRTMATNITMTNMKKRNAANVTAIGAGISPIRTSAINVISNAIRAIVRPIAGVGVINAVAGSGAVRLSRALKK